MWWPIPLQPSTAQTRSRPLAGRSVTHRGEPGLIGAEPAATETVSSAVITSIVADRLCGSIPITTRSSLSLMHASSRCSIRHWLSSREGNATSSCANPS